MRNIFFLLISILCFQAGFSQVQPSAKDVEAMKRQAITDARNMVTDLKKQIAEAKLNKEDPDNIQEMEKQLATMQRTVDMLERTNLTHGRPTSLPVTKTVLPKYTSPIVAIPLKQPVVAPTKLQARDTLLWYSGKKLNDSMLVTSQSTVVLYSRRRNMVVIQADKNKDSTCLGIARSLARCRQWTTDFVDNLATTKNSFFDYPGIVNTMDEFKFIEETYNEILKNTIKLPWPAAPITNHPYHQNTGSGLSNYFDFKVVEPFNFLEVLHQNLVNYMNNTPPVQVTKPPAFYNSCTDCGNFNKRHERLRDWRAEFLKYEQGLLDKMAAVKIWMMKENITTANSGIPTLAHDLNNALFMAFDRCDQKISQLEQMNSVDFLGNNMFFTHIVIESLLYIQVLKKNYYGIVDDSYTTRINNLLVKNQQGIIDYYERDMGWYRFNDVFDTWIVAGFDRHYKILKGSGEPLRGLVEKIKAFNRFALTITIEFSIEQTGTDNAPIVEAEGKITNKDKVYVSMGRLGNCRWQLFLTNTDYTKQDEKTFRIPLIVEQGTKYTYLRNPVRVVMKSYSGPKDMLMVFPYTNFSVCYNRDPDSLVVDILRYEQENLSQYHPGQNEYSVDLLQYVNKIFISAEKTKTTSSDVLSQAYEMMNAAFIHGRVDRPTGYPKLDIMQVDFKMKGIQQHHQEMLSRLTHFPNTLVNFDAMQGSPTIADIILGRSNTELEGKYNLKTGRVYFHVVHDPQ